MAIDTLPAAIAYEVKSKIEFLPSFPLLHIV